MGTTTRTITITTCDRCGAETTTDPLSAWNGYGTVRHESIARGYDGASGGLQRDVVLCRGCDHGLGQFLAGGGAVPLVKDGTDKEHERWALVLRDILMSVDAPRLLTEANFTGRNHLAQRVLSLADAIRAHDQGAPGA